MMQLLLQFNTGSNRIPGGRILYWFLAYLSQLLRGRYQITFSDDYDELNFELLCAITVSAVVISIAGKNVSVVD
jgi:hypothetical protein